jgi:6-carboxyhexanoate--CoA ligase
MKSMFYSIRMRATCEGRHVSGAERIVRPEAIDTAVRELAKRAMDRLHSPDKITVTVETLGDQPLRRIKALNLTSLDIPSVEAARLAAISALQNTGVSLLAAENGVRYLNTGASTAGHPMRGAIIMDSRTGERLEPDRERGVRASRFDWDEQALMQTRQRFAELGLTHFRTFEALALATKVAHAPGVIAELCWSDDPDYTAGYVASLQSGYLRYPALKAAGDSNGGRVFFINGCDFDLGAFINYLQTEPVLIA